MKKMKLSLLCLLVLCGICLLGVSAAFCQVPPTLDEGIRQYQKENYEEAIDVLTQVRKQDPRSSMAAFLLGMAYKQTNNIPAAEQQLKDAVILQPPVREAVVELIDVLINQGKIDEAKNWISLAEKNEILPAKIAFLKGMALAAEGDCQWAIDAFEKSKKLDVAYTQSADLQIGVCYMNMRKYGMAKQRFATAITQDPLSDLGSFARRYQDLVEERSFLERPLRVTIGVMGQYDTNMLSEPTWYQPASANDLWSRDEKSFNLMSTARLDYVPVLTGPFVFNASYAIGNRLNEKFSTSYDLIANTFSANPGVTFGRFMVNLAGNYTYIMKRNPSYTRYSDNYSVGPLLRFLLSPNHILEASAAYAAKNYFETVPNPDLTDQTSTGLDSYVGWYWLFGDGGGMLNLRYGFNTESAKGRYFDYQGHRFTANFMMPLFFKPLRLQVGGEIYLQGYLNENDPVYNRVKRNDQTYMGMAGLYWDINRRLTLIAQYTKTRVFSNCFIYDFNRDVYALGLELRL